MRPPINRPIGVDLVELRTARAFYRAHHKALASYFHPAELRFIESGPRPHERLAMVWAAKEAVSKLKGDPVVGPGALRALRLQRSGRGLRSGRLTIDLLKRKRYVVACCHAMGTSR